MTSTITAEVEIEAPLHEVYEQWMRFEDYPDFIAELADVEQLGEAGTRWTVDLGGVRHRFDTAIVEQLPDDRVEWVGADARAHSGTASFESVDGGRTRVSVEFSWEPETFLEKTGALLGVDGRTVQTALERFKEYMEERGGGHHARRTGLEQPQGS